MRTLLLAFLSGIPALVYEVVWTREVALLAGSQVEAISVVLVAFFGGLALGARWLGARADRVASPLLFYGALEIAAGLGAALSIGLLRALAQSPLAAASGAAQTLVAAAILLPVTFLLGGTVPALMRSAVRDVAASARHAGWLVGANTAGSVLGVGAAVWLIPQLGLRATALGAACGAVAIGAAALLLARGAPQPIVLESRISGTPRPLVLAAAVLAGVATLAFEVLAARMAMLRLGSSLYAWGAVLACFLVGLAAGNLAFARRAASTEHPERDLGRIQLAAAIALALGLFLLRPSLLGDAAGVTPQALYSIAISTLPAAILMGAAFPFLVRLVVAGPQIGAGFGLVSAVNTAGGIIGALLAPFVLLPALGPVGGALVCAGINALVGAVFLARSAGAARPALIRVGSGLACTAAAASLALVPPPAPEEARILHVGNGRQATAVVVATGARRDLIVDGDPEASTGGNARRTEELLASLPLLVHPDPQAFLELGLGSGITLGTAARFGLERVDCVEIAPSVIRAARYFAPDNGAATRPDRVQITRGDARVFLARHPRSYDVIVANTLHPWSVGATGLYSHEYFTRIREALQPGGIAAQWLPAERIGADSLTLILRTFYEVFPEGFLWWGAQSLIALGSDAPIALPSGEQIRTRLEPSGLRLPALGMADAKEIGQRRIAGAAAVRSALGPGELVTDDRPVLERRAARGRSPAGDADLLAVLVGVARAGLEEDRRVGPLLLWIESRQARAAGDEPRAKGREVLAEQAGLALARRLRIERRVARGQRALSEKKFDGAEYHFRAALLEDPAQRQARFGLAAIAYERGDPEAAQQQLRRLLADHPDHAEAWNMLGAVLGQGGDLRSARRAFYSALEVNPFFPQALANTGLLAVAQGDRRGAERMLERLRAISPLGASPEELLVSDAMQ